MILSSYFFEVYDFIVNAKRRKIKWKKRYDNWYSIENLLRFIFCLHSNTSTRFGCFQIRRIKMKNPESRRTIFIYSLKFVKRLALQRKQFFLSGKYTKKIFSPYIPSKCVNIYLFLKTFDCLKICLCWYRTEPKSKKKNQKKTTWVINVFVRAATNAYLLYSLQSTLYTIHAAHFTNSSSHPAEWKSFGGRKIKKFSFCCVAVPFILNIEWQCVQSNRFSFIEHYKRLFQAI